MSQASPTTVEDEPAAPAPPDTPAMAPTAGSVPVDPSDEAAAERAEQLEGEPAPAGLPVVDLREVTRSFPGPPVVEALHPVSLRVHRGQYLSIVGPSGSGKSTLLNILGLLDRPTSGEYWLDGLPTHTAGERERTALRGGLIGFVFQAFHLLPHRTVLENVLLATMYSRLPREERLRRAYEALCRVGLEHRIGFKPTTLSGGERQRVAVARAVVTSPRLLLADEPTGNLDTTTSAEVLDLFDELHADGLTLLVITHDNAVAARAERSVRITDGVLRELET